MKESLESAIIKSFATIPEVQEIWRKLIDDHCTFYIFLENLKYNRALMSKLIDIQIKLEDCFTDTSFKIEYIPGFVAPNVILSQGCYCVFCRGKADG